MGFVRIIEFRTSDIDAVLAQEDEWRSATEGRRTLRREVLCRDRDHPEVYVAINFFDSYESARANSALPETQAGAARMDALCDGEPSFWDLDVVRDRL
jgi:hypothetical protein